MIAAFLWHFIPLAWLRSRGRRERFAARVLSRAVARYERKAGRDQAAPGHSEALARIYARAGKGNR